jgi:hypothetical protein
VLRGARRRRAASYVCGVQGLAIYGRVRLTALSTAKSITSIAGANASHYLCRVGQLAGRLAFMAYRHGGQLIAAVPDIDVVVLVAAELDPVDPASRVVPTNVFPRVQAPIAAGYGRAGSGRPGLVDNPVRPAEQPSGLHCEVLHVLLLPRDLSVRPRGQDHRVSLRRMGALEVRWIGR